ncbi:hypothetical protein AB0B10_25840 [Micromonospora arborensis]|uniref:hypothetical protein n=1 Tax=Micromonospora arborensis TaxID=2116518 RepID=UPI0033EEF188
MPALSRAERSDIVHPALSGARDRLLAKITELFPTWQDSLPVPALEVPAADAYEAAIAQLYANLYDECGNKSDTWISAREQAANPKAVTEVYDLISDWYVLVGAAYLYLGGRARGRFDMEVERVSARLL